MSDSGKNAIRKGGCLCGAVRYEVQGEPKMTVICHCEMCQKLSGAGHALHAMVAESAFRVTGATKGYAWTADSGNKVTTEFCPNCGSPLFGRNSGYPGMVGLRVASLDNSAAIEPQIVVFAKRKRSWDHDYPSLPTFPAMPPAPSK